MDSTDLKLKRARTAMLIKEPFFGSLALHMEMKADNSIKHCVSDGHTIRYNERFIDTLDHDQTVGLIAAQVMHAAFMHPLRRGNREVKKWNQACDYATHQILKEAGFSLPEEFIIDAKYKDMTAEHIYSMLPDNPQGNQGKGKGKGGGGQGQSQQGDGEGEGEGEDNSDPNGGVDDHSESQSAGASAARQHAAENEMKQQVAQAAHVAKQAGKLPGAIERMMGELMEAKLDWREILRRFMTEKANDDFSWQRGNRRFVAQGLYLPSRVSEGSGEIAVAIDTSGSIGQKELDEFASEVQAIVKDVKPSKVYVIYCDAEVNHVDTFAPEDDMHFKLHGGGGTDFRPPFDWMEQNQVLPKCFVYLTDGYGPFPEEPEFPCMWAINNHDVTPPWGEHFIMETDA